MIDAWRELVEEICELTGAEAPALFGEHAPVLEAGALGDEEMYLVGLIGGKDVGKSALVNALVGREITLRTSWGPGTEMVVAYAHEDQITRLNDILNREAPGAFRIHTHRLEHLRRQVLLDLPDIDSHYRAHIELTRRMLRHMLFPVWVQSVEKYADRQPRELLSLVAEGNAPGNFVFCLNKVDQLASREGEEAIEELREDFARRLMRSLDLGDPPRVWMISALEPDRFDLPALKALLSDERSKQSVRTSRERALARQGATLSHWIDLQHLDQRLEALERLQRLAEEELAARVAGPVIEQILPKLMEDPANRLALADELMNRRVNQWPVVNVLHVMLGPLMAVLRRRLPIDQQRSLEGAQDLVNVHLRSLPSAEGNGAGQGLAQRIASTFSTLQQSSPQVLRLYAHWKLWEPLAAEGEEVNLRTRLANALERQRQVIRECFAFSGILGVPLRVLLTIGALLWFPFVQPLLEAFLKGSAHVGLLAVQILGVPYLLKNVTFLAIYFLVLWMLLRWDTQRKVDRMLGRWKQGQALEPTLGLAGQVIEWSRDLLRPVEETTDRMRHVVEKAKALEQTGREAA